MRHFAFLAPLVLAACVSATQIDRAPLAAEGAAVGLHQPVALGDAVVTPMRVVEDSRCPINARCVWAGRVVVETRVDGPGWRETVPMELGEPQALRDMQVALVSAEPGRTTQEDVPAPEDYRFVFEGG